MLNLTFPPFSLLTQGPVFNIYMYLTRIYGNLKQIQPDLVCSYFVFVFFRMPNLIQPATRVPAAGFETLGAETDKRQSQRLEALHHGGLWGCPLVYSTTIAPYQRATSRASMSRALWHNAEMQDGVKHFLAAHLQLSLVRFTIAVSGDVLCNEDTRPGRIDPTPDRS